MDGELQDDHLRLTEMRAAAHGGRYSGSGTLYWNPSPRFDGTLWLDGVQLERLLLAVMPDAQAQGSVSTLQAGQRCRHDERARCSRRLDGNPGSCGETLAVPTWAASCVSAVAVRCRAEPRASRLSRAAEGGGRAGQGGDSPARCGRAGRRGHARVSGRRIAAGPGTGLCAGRRSYARCRSTSPDRSRRRHCGWSLKFRGRPGAAGAVVGNRARSLQAGSKWSTISWTLLCPLYSLTDSR